jgi:transposase
MSGSLRGHRGRSESLSDSRPAGTRPNGSAMEGMNCKADYAEYVMEIMRETARAKRRIGGYIHDNACDTSIIRLTLRGARWTISKNILTGLTMPRKKPMPAKLESLRRQGSLNVHPERVTDPLFQERDFFDPNDLVQVKYEMLRRVEVDKLTVSQAAAAFGLSRPTFYQARFDFEQGGLPGLIPKKPGPRTAHKFTAEILEFMRAEREANATLRAADLADLVRERFGVMVHSNSVDRALRRKEKKQQ